MWKKMWTDAEFAAWIDRVGLSYPQAASVLEISEPTVYRAVKGISSIKDSTALAAIAYETNSRTTTGRDGEDLDDVAETMDLAGLCADLPHAYVTSVTSALARGWGTLNGNGIRHMCQPERLKQPEVSGIHKLIWTSHKDDVWGIECRVDSNGSPYRIASIERTLLDMTADEFHLGESIIEEVFHAAFEFGDQKPDIKLLCRKAGERGQEAFDQLRHFLRPYDV